MSTHRNRREAGVSLVEALIAVGLLFIIAAGILPLFSRAIVNNATGADSTLITTQSRQVLEDAASSPFNQPAWTIPAGTTLVQRDQVWITDETTSTGPMASHVGRWYTLGVDALPADRTEGARLGRRTSVWQFGVGQWDANTPLDTGVAYDGITNPDFVQLKLVEVDLRSYPRQYSAAGLVLEDRWSTMLGTMRPMRVRYFKAF